MHIVPVIDLLEGRVVRAVRGERQRYRPVVSTLCRSAAPPAVAQVLCEHCATDTLYVADLDALQGRPVQVAALIALLQAQPALQLWLDAGFASRDDFEALQAGLGPLSARVIPVYASESLRSADELLRCFATPAQGLLSLDRRGGLPLDRAGVWAAPARWPQRLIVMTLDRVGSAEGPDLAALAAVRERAPGARLIGAGGVRDATDLRAAAAAGADAWLVASALHDGRLDRATLRELATQCAAAEAADPAAATQCRATG